MKRRNDILMQSTLFKRTLEEIIDETGSGINELIEWNKKGWLSFSLGVQKEYDDKEKYEINFVKGLVRSGLPEDSVSFMLSKLEKPYCYDYKDVYWDFAVQDWREFEHFDEIEIIENGLDSYLESKAEDEELEDLEKIVRYCKELLARHQENEESEQ